MSSPPGDRSELRKRERRGGVDKIKNEAAARELSPRIHLARDWSLLSFVLKATPALQKATNAAENQRSCPGVAS